MNVIFLLTESNRFSFWKFSNFGAAVKGRGLGADLGGSEKDLGLGYRDIVPFWSSAGFINGQF